MAKLSTILTLPLYFNQSNQDIKGRIEDIEQEFLTRLRLFNNSNSFSEKNNGFVLGETDLTITGEFSRFKSHRFFEKLPSATNIFGNSVQYHGTLNDSVSDAGNLNHFLTFNKNKRQRSINTSFNQSNSTAISYNSYFENRKSAESRISVEDYFSQKLNSQASSNKNEFNEEDKILFKIRKSLNETNESSVQNLFSPLLTLKFNYKELSFFQRRLFKSILSNQNFFFFDEEFKTEWFNKTLVKISQHLFFHKGFTLFGKNISLRNLPLFKKFIYFFIEASEEENYIAALKNDEMALSSNTYSLIEKQKLFAFMLYQLIAPHSAQIYRSAFSFFTKKQMLNIVHACEYNEKELSITLKILPDLINNEDSF